MGSDDYETKLKEFTRTVSLELTKHKRGSKERTICLGILSKVFGLEGDICQLEEEFANAKKDIAELSKSKADQPGDVYTGFPPERK